MDSNGNGKKKRLLDSLFRFNEEMLKYIVADKNGIDVTVTQETRQQSTRPVVGLVAVALLAIALGSLAVVIHVNRDSGQPIDASQRETPEGKAPE